MDFQDIDELLELLDHLLKDLIIAHDHDGHPGDLVVLGGTHVEGVDVEAPAAKKPGDPGKHPEPVLDHDGNGVTHKGRC